MSHVQMDHMVAERVEYEDKPGRAQFIIGAMVITLAIVSLLSVIYLPSSTNPKAYVICGAEGFSRDTVNRAKTAMRDSTATRDEKLAAFMQSFGTVRNETGLQNCGRAILRESEKGTDWLSELWSQ